MMTADHMDYLVRQRKLSAEVLSTMNVHSEGHAIILPFMENQKEINYKAINPSTKDMWMGKDMKRTFYNVDSVEQGRSLIITEGEWDTLTLLSAGYKNVVSVPNGAKSDLNFLAGVKNIRGVNSFLLCLDDDEPGRELRGKLLNRLTRGRCFTVDYGQGCKDINEVMQMYGVDGVKEVIENREPALTSGRSNFGDPNTQKIPVKISTGYECLDPHFRLYEGCFALITGARGSGKSKFVNNVAGQLARLYGFHISICSLEVVKPVIEAEFEDYAKAHGSTAEEIFGYREDTKLHFIHQDEAYNAMSVDDALERARVDKLMYDSQVLVLDPWNRFINKREQGEDKQDTITRVLNKISAFARETGMIVLCVAHPTKSYFSEEREVRSMDVDHGTMFNNICDLALVVSRSDTQRDLATFLVDKVRYGHDGDDIGEVHMRFQCGKYIQESPEIIKKPVWRD